ncbi:MAG: motif domain protein [Ramlibacter sp.]|nr:motif domain protein [Ramlibacter sp.]
MAKKSRTKARDQQTETAEGAVGPRQPCPCGSGRRYKACHGAAGGAPDVYVARPFEGMPSECDVVALRELVPAATAPLTLKDHPDKIVKLCSMLPMAAPAMVRDSGEIWLGLQVQHNFGDPARDLGAVLTAALEAEPGIVGLTTPPGEGPRLQDLISDESLAITVHDGFDYWIADVDADERAGMAAALEQANDSVTPTAKLTSVEAAYWTNVGPKEHLRWVMPEPEDRLLDALARLHAAGKDELVPGSRFVGMFRAHGLLVPVWDLPVGTGPEPLEEPAERFAADLAAALADGSDLTAEQRSARSGLANRQVTIR